MMKSFFKKLAFVMALAMVVSLAAPAAKTAVAAEATEKKPLAIAYQEGAKISTLNLKNIGDKEDLRFLYAPANYKELGTPMWRSTDPSIVEVDNNGVVTAKAAGHAQVMVVVGAEMAVIDVYSVDMKTFEATIGTPENRAMDTATIEIGEKIDFAFYGIEDYSADRYNCEWFPVDPEGVIEVCDFSTATPGLVTAKKAGTAKLTLAVINLVTMQRTDVKSVTITVPAEEPEVNPGIEIVNGINKTEKSVVVALTDLDSKDYSGVMANKLMWEVYAVEEGSYEYAWEIATAVADTEANTVTLTGYDEFDHKQPYVVRIVDSNDTGNNNVKYETDFVASVGPVATIDLDYASYRNNQGTYTFTKEKYGCAFTNGNDAGEEIQTRLSYKLYDADGVDVTGHYDNASNGYDIVTYEILSEEVAPYVNIFENELGETVMTFEEILDQPLVLRAVYEDYDNFLTDTNTKVDDEVIPVKQAPEYKVNPVDNWDIVRTYPGSEDRLLKNNRFKRQWMALFDDYDQASDVELLNHHIALWFTDNYGNYFTTLSENDGKYKTIENSAKFTTEGYEIHFETRHPQVLVVGLSEGDTTDETITSKKVGTAVVNVTLHNTVRNDYDSTLVNHIDKLAVTIKPERQIDRIDVPSQLKLATDSDPFGATTTVATTTTFGDYDTRWTTGDVKFAVIDNYDAIWGSVNDSRLTYTDIVITTDSEVNEQEMVVDATAWDTSDKKYLCDNDNVAGVKKFDGAQLFDELMFNNVNKDENIKNNKTTYIKYTITVEDSLKEVVQKKTATFNISLMQPTHDVNDIDKDLDALEIIHSANLKLDEKNSDKSVLNTDLETEISLVEYSKNNIPVNYMDGVTLITTKAQYDNIFNNKNHAEAIASKGDLFLVVYDTKNNILGESDTETIGIYEKESGLYGFRVANTYNGTQATEFATLGTYTVRVLQVTEAVAGKNIVAKTAYSIKVEVKDGRGAINMVDQKKIYVADESDIKVIAFDAISFNEEDYKNNDGYVAYDAAKLAGVKYRENTRANSVVIQNVYFKVYIAGADELDDDGAYYYISTVVNRTVKLNVNGVSGTSIKKLDNAALDANN